MMAKKMSSEEKMEKERYLPEDDFPHLGACAASSSKIHQNSDQCELPSQVEKKIHTNQEEFLVAIHKRFLDTVHPVESGLVDELRGAEALSSEDEQSITHDPVRRTRARKLWNLLHKIPEEDFAGCFIPRLKAVYPHVMEGMDFKMEDELCSTHCLRHAIKIRIKITKLIDILKSTQSCSVIEYRRWLSLTEQYCEDKEWEDMFQVLQKNAHNVQLCREVELLLQKKKINVPEGFQTVAVSGFPCSCFSVPDQFTELKKTGTEDLALLERDFRDILPLDNLEKEGSTATYPSSPLSSKSLDDDMCLDSGIRSIDDSFLQPALFASLEPFQTSINKAQYRNLEERINTALAMSSSIRTDFRYLEKTRDDARSLSKQARDETRSAKDNQMLQSLLQKAKEYQARIKELFRCVSETWEDVRDLEICLSFDLPDSWRNYLMIRHHLLRNEFQECVHIVRSAQEVADEVAFFCQPLELVEKGNESPDGGCG